MLKKTTSFIALVLTLFLLSGLSVFSQVGKKILFEQFTGTWCGWCVDGNHKLNQIMEEHSDVVIPVKLHSDDNMAINYYSSIGDGLGLSGVPAGCIDRTMFNGTYFPNRYSGSYSNNNWLTLVEQQMQETAKVEVELVYSLDEQTGEFKAALTATMLEDLDKNLAFNLIIIEDSVSGSGQGWDQHNYLSGRSGWEFSPYYSKPSVLEGYVHEYVARDYLGGAWGEPGEFLSKTTLETGDVFKHYFTTTLNPSWDLDHLKFAGVVFVDESADKRALNSCYGVEGTPEEPVMDLSSTGTMEGVASSGSAFTKTFNLDNLSDSEDTYELTVTTSERTPDDWSAEITVQDNSVTVKKENQQATEITIPAGETATFDLSLNVGETIGVGDAYIVITSQNNSDSYKEANKITAISKDAEYIHVIDVTEQENSIASYFENEEVDYLDLSPTNYSEFYTSLDNLKVLIWNTGEGDDLSESEANTITSVINSGHKVFLSGQLIMTYLYANDQLANLGLGRQGLSQDGYSQGAQPPFSTRFKGFADDPISGNYVSGFDVEWDNYPMQVAEITNSDIAEPFLAFEQEQTVWYVQNNQWNNKQVDGEDCILGARITKGGRKTVLFGIDPFIIVDEQTREDLLTNAMDWLLETTDVEDKTGDNAFVTISASPNPISDETRIKYNFGDIGSIGYKISLFNQLGEEVALIKEGTAKPGTHKINYSPNGLTSGMYFLILKCGEEIVSKPVSIVR